MNNPEDIYDSILANTASSAVYKSSHPSPEPERKSLGLQRREWRRKFKDEMHLRACVGAKFAFPNAYGSYKKKLDRIKNAAKRDSDNQP